MICECLVYRNQRSLPAICLKEQSHADLTLYPADGEPHMANDGYESEAQREGAGSTVSSPCRPRQTRIMRDQHGPPHRSKQQSTSAPSGIAQLREANQSLPTIDDMNIDDFIDPNSTASPANLTPSPPTPPSNTTASAIPIKQKKEIQEQGLHHGFPPSAPSHERSRNPEFDYVQRRVRKTSIDETKVRPYRQGSGMETLTDTV